MDPTVGLNLDVSSYELEREYVDFFDSSEKYKDKISELINTESVRLIVNINDLRQHNPARTSELLKNSFEELAACQRALKKCVTNANPEYGKMYDVFFVGFEGSFGSKHVSPRTLSSNFLGTMVCIEGIVTKCSLVRPKIVRSVHFCPATKKTIERRYTDLASLEAYPSSGVYPTKDEDGNLLETEFGLSCYADHQTLTLQEMPENAPAGQLPRSVDIICDNDLVDQCKPGDRVQIVGQHRCLPNKQSGYTSGAFRCVVIANHVHQLSKETELCFTASDIEKIKKFCRQSDVDVFALLARSIAPSIHGHDFVKRAILCQLLGGVERHLENGTRIRGDINVMLIGDPSVAKSQILRYVLHSAPRAIATTGRGSSGVGLTAAVTHDPESGERQLEAGAMVLADRGIVCIDEFDKMSDIDRTAIHEVMEQGCVTISKAGIHAKLNARCSVLAAANPVYGRYDQYKSPMENINMQDSLLSRFDLLFILLDRMDPESDRLVAQHVLQMHRYRNAGEQEGEPLPLTADQELLSTENRESAANGEEEETPVYEVNDRFAAMGGRPGASGTRRGANKDRLVSLKFLQKYVHVAKRIRPLLTREAADYLSERYADLRSHEETQGAEGGTVKRTQPVTARTLETLIRLSTAHAKARMSKEVKMRDAESAVELISYAIFKEVVEKVRHKRSRRNDDDSENESEEEEGGGASQKDSSTIAEDGSSQHRRAAKRRSVVRRQDDEDDEDVSSQQVDTDSRASTRSRKAAPPTDPNLSGAVLMEEEEIEEVHLSVQRLTVLRPLVSRVFQEGRMESIPIVDLIRLVHSGPAPSDPAHARPTEAEIRAVLKRLHEDNRLMLTSSDVWLI